MTSSILEKIEMAPKDPILGVTEAYVADQNPKKVNLGVGVYTDENGKVPVLQCVRTAEKKLGENATPRNYLPIDGIAAYDRAVQETLFGKDTPAVKDGRIVTVQTLGGTGGLKVGGDFLKRFNPGADIYISDPSWENHRAIFEYAGYTVKTYPYYDAATNGLKFDAMLACFEQLPARAIVLLHACCHNPTGVDLTPEQWEKVIDVVNRRDLVPFLDIAYQGFAEGLEEDAATIRRFTAECNAVFVSSSFSKSLSLYGERVGALSIVTKSKEEAARTLSQLKRVIRTNYSSPPTTGVLAYRAATALFEGVKRAKSLDIDKIITTMEDMKFDTPGGPFTLRKKDHQSIGTLFFGEYVPSDKEPYFALKSVKAVDEETVVEPPSPGAEYLI